MSESEQFGRPRQTWVALLIGAGVAAAVVPAAPAVAQKTPPGPQGALIGVESQAIKPPPPGATFSNPGKFEKGAGSPGATSSNPGKLEKGTGANKLDGGGIDGTKAVAPMFNKGNKTSGGKQDGFQGGCAQGTNCPSASDKWTGPTLTRKSGKFEKGAGSPGATFSNPGKLEKGPGANKFKKGVGSPGATFSNPGKLEQSTGANKLDGGGQDGTKAVAPMFNKGSGNRPRPRGAAPPASP